MYKGNISPKATFEALQEQAGAVLVDVRTRAEWAYVGIPAYEGLIQITWKPIPGTDVDPHFVEEMMKVVPDRDAPIYLICRSGVRSAFAAQALTVAGYTNCYNVEQGFEGDKDAHGHRGTVGGWKVAGLPWIQS